MTTLCHSFHHVPIQLRATRLYEWEEVRELCKKSTGPYSLRVEGTLIPLLNEWELRLACKVAAAYHRWVACDALEDDGFSADMAAREERIAAELEEDSDEN
jgi:hypothetical protein